MVSMAVKESDNTGLYAHFGKSPEHILTAVALNEDITATSRATGAKFLLQRGGHIKEVSVRQLPTGDESSGFSGSSLAFHYYIHPPFLRRLFGLFFRKVSGTFGKVRILIAELTELILPVHHGCIADVIESVGSGRCM